jgi:RNA 3'-terminal phosphate cyclase
VPGKQEAANAFLTEQLADGDWHGNATVKAAAIEQGVAERTLRRAVKILGVENKREGFPSTTLWRLGPGQSRPVAATPASRGQSRPSEPSAPAGTVVAAVQRDLAALRQVDAKLADSALAATALELAKQLDEGENSATSKSMCARTLQEIMKELRALAPAEREADGIDDLAARRASRRTA